VSRFTSARGPEFLVRVCFAQGPIRTRPNSFGVSSKLLLRGRAVVSLLLSVTSSGGQDQGAQSGSQYAGLLAGMIGVQSIESVAPEALLPANDRGRRGLELSLDSVEGRAFRQHQNQLGAKHVSGRPAEKFKRVAIAIALI
jgi:hypothetical protein